MSLRKASGPRAHDFLVALIFAVLASSNSVSAQTPAEPEKPKPRPKFLNLRYNEDFSYLEDLRGEDNAYATDWGDPLKNIDLGGDWRMDIGGEFRFRLEAKSNAAFGRSLQTQNTQQFYRWMVHFDIRHRDLFRVFVQGIVAHAEDQDGPFNFLHENHGDLQQLFFDLRLGGDQSPFVLRVGRQDLLYGNQRFVSPLEWASTRRRFDAVKLMYSTPTWDVDAFYAKPVVVKREQGDDWNEDFDFWGVYSTYKGWENHGLDLYFLGIDRTQDTLNPNGNSGDQSIFTLGSRFFGKTGGFDYEAEVAGQWGTWAGDTVQAWSWTIDGGHTWKELSCQPRIGAGFDWASGDEDPFDGKVGTFNQMFPLGHKYFGFLDLIGRQNITAMNVNMSAWAIPKKVKARIAYHTFWLNDSRDALYNVGGAPTLRDPSGRSGEQVGHELDLTVAWKIDVHSSMLFGYSHFFDSNFVHRLVSDDDDPDFFYVQYQLKF